MLQYVLKRLLWLVPTLWLICSVVFFLSKAVPGTCLDWQRGDLGQTIYNSRINSNNTTSPVIPLFYFSVQSHAEPDTLYRMQPEAHRKFLKRFTLLSGNWPALAAFYRTLTSLQNEADALPDVPAIEKQQLKYQLESIFTLTEESSIRQTLLRVRNQVNTRLYPVTYGHSVTLGLRQLNGISNQKNITALLVPTVVWHGLNNEYHSWLKNFITGNFGISCRDEQPVNQIIAEAFANTFIITIISLILIFFLASEISIWLSKASKFKWRQSVLLLLYALDSVPLFIVALVLLTLFASNNYLNIFPAYGFGPDSVDGVAPYLNWLYQLPYFALPVISLTLANLPHVTGQTYQAMQQLQHRDFILTAKAKGLPEQIILRRHVWRNALLPVITLFTGFLPALVTGTVIIEIIFAMPGMGQLLQQSVQTRDFPVLLGIVFYLGLIKMGSHILADVLYFLADPRIRLQP